MSLSIYKGWWKLNPKYWHKRTFENENEKKRERRHTTCAKELSHLIYRQWCCTNIPSLLTTSIVNNNPYIARQTHCFELRPEFIGFVVAAHCGFMIPFWFNASIKLNCTIFLISNTAEQKTDNNEILVTFQSILFLVH